MSTWPENATNLQGKDDVVVKHSYLGLLRNEYYMTPYFQTRGRTMASAGREGPRIRQAGAGRLLLPDLVYGPSVRGEGAEVSPISSRCPLHL